MRKILKLKRKIIRRIERLLDFLNALKFLIALFDKHF